MPHDHYDYAGSANHLQYSLMKRRMIQQDIKWYNKNLDIHDLLEHKFSLEEDNPETQNNKILTCNDTSLPELWRDMTNYTGNLRRDVFSIGVDTEYNMFYIFYELIDYRGYNRINSMYCEAEVTLPCLVSTDPDQPIKFYNSALILNIYSNDDAWGSEDRGFILDNIYDSNNNKYTINIHRYDQTDLGTFINIDTDMGSIEIPTESLPTIDDPYIRYTLGLSIELGYGGNSGLENNFAKLMNKEYDNNVTITEDLKYQDLRELVHPTIYQFIKAYTLKNDPISEGYNFADDYVVKVKFNYGTEPFKYKDLANQYIMDAAKVEMEEGVLNE